MPLEPALFSAMPGHLGCVHIKDAIAGHLRRTVPTLLAATMHVPRNDAQHLATLTLGVCNGFGEVGIAPVFILASKITAPNVGCPIAKPEGTIVRDEHEGRVIALVDQRPQPLC